MAKTKQHCAMCDRPIKGSSGGIYPPHETARYCLKCHGRIWIIIQGQCRALRESLAIQIAKELPKSMAVVQKRLLGVLK